MRLIATDLDGTIVDGRGGISSRTRTTLSTARAAGVILVAVTGRPRRWMTEIIRELPFFDHVICSNGALVAHAETLDIEYIRPISVSALKRVIQQSLTLFPEADVGTESPIGLTVTASGSEPWRRSAQSEVPTGTALQDVPDVVKVLLRERSWQPDQLHQQLTAAVGDVVEVTYSSATDPLMEMSGRGTHKGAALAVLAEQLGVAAADCVAFGDMPNDVSMLQWVGRGYAMADGHPSAVAATPWHAPALCDDGVAVVVEQLLTDVIWDEQRRQGQ